MKVAFLIGPTISGRRNGVVSQALTWMEGLKSHGIVVDLITPWETFDWSEYDLIHVFGTGFYLDVIKLLRLKGVSRIILSPIFDDNKPAFILKVLSRLNFARIGCKTAWASLREAMFDCDLVLTRSKFESNRLNSVFGVTSRKLEICSLPVRSLVEITTDIDKEPLCLHVSILSSKNKNVRRLIEASIKYGFPLCLAGQVNDLSFRDWLNGVLQSHPHISYVGVVSNEELYSLYRSAKVFALPSLMEGVGLVALEAASAGSDIVITERGGPKEYYNGLAKIINPESVDEIGAAVVQFLSGETFQPDLSNHIRENFTVSASAAELSSVYYRLLEGCFD